MTTVTQKCLKKYIYILKYILGETNIKSQFVIYAKTQYLPENDRYML